jgi:hypothetical protein
MNLNTHLSNSAGLPNVTIGANTYYAAYSICDEN